MSKADDFRHYADEAMRWAYQPRNEKNKQALIELARTWTEAAVQSDRISIIFISPVEARPAL